MFISIPSASARARLGGYTEVTERQWGEPFPWELCGRDPATPDRMLSQRRGAVRSLAGQLPVEAGEGDGEGLQSAQWVPVVQREGVLGHTAELQHYIVGCEHRPWGDPGPPQQREVLFLDVES